MARFKAILPIGLPLLLLLLAPAQSEEKILFETKSAFNTIIVSEEESGLRTLRFEELGARQSVIKLGDPEHLELPYSQVMAVALACVKDPKRVLIVGLGGGAIPSFLRKQYPQMFIDVVEIDPQVVAVAKEYFGFREDARMRVYVKDGRRFIEERRGVYDIIFLDAYDADSIPHSLVTREFLTAVRKAMKDDGVVAGNLWSSSWDPSYRSMVRTYEDVFIVPCVLDVPDASNKIVIALASQQIIERRKLIIRARAISTGRKFRFDMGDFVKAGLRNSREDSQYGRVLRDGDRREK